MVADFATGSREFYGGAHGVPRPGAGRGFDHRVEVAGLWGLAGKFIGEDRRARFVDVLRRRRVTYKSLQLAKGFAP